MATVKTFVMIKPDGVERKLVGQIIARFEQKGFTILEMKMIVPKRELIEEHYAEHKGKPFYEGLVDYVSRGTVVPMVIEGPENTIKMIRQMIGATFSYDATPGTIRGDFGIMKHENLIHASDSEESAQRELKLWF